MTFQSCDFLQSERFDLQSNIYKTMNISLNIYCETCKASHVCFFCALK